MEYHIGSLEISLQQHFDFLKSVNFEGIKKVTYDRPDCPPFWFEKNFTEQIESLSLSKYLIPERYLCEVRLKDEIDLERLVKVSNFMYNHINKHKEFYILDSFPKKKESSLFPDFKRHNLKMSIVEAGNVDEQILQVYNNSKGRIVDFKFWDHNRGEALPLIEFYLAPDCFWEDWMKLPAAEKDALDLLKRL
jgi:hypothetical protein